MVTVCTVLPPPERPRVDAVGDGCFDTLHAESLREALYVARRRRVDVVIISVHRCHEARDAGQRLPGAAMYGDDDHVYAPAARASCASSPLFLQSLWCHDTTARLRRRCCGC